MSEITYQLYTIDRLDDVHKLLIGSFIQEEPISACVLDVFSAYDLFKKIAIKGAEEGVSFIAIDSKTDEVIGCRISLMSKRGEDADAEDELFNDPSLSKAISGSFRHGFSVKGDFYGEFPDANLVFEFLAVSVHKNYRRRGIAEKMIQLSLDLARKRGFDHVHVLATSFKTQRLFPKLGFTDVRSLDLQSFTLEDGSKPMESIPEANKFCKFFVLKLK